MTIPPPPQGLFWIRTISGRNPYQATLMVWLVISGFSVFLSAPPPDSVQRLLPQWAVYVWGAGLFVGGLTNLIGVYWRGRRPETGLRLELFSSSTVMMFDLVYPGALIWRLFTVPAEQAARIRGSWFIIGMLIALAIAAAVRVRQVRNALREVRQLRRAGL